MLMLSSLYPSSARPYTEIKTHMRDIQEQLEQKKQVALLYSQQKHQKKYKNIVKLNWRR